MNKGLTTTDAKNLEALRVQLREENKSQIKAKIGMRKKVYLMAKKATSQDRSTKEEGLKELFDFLKVNKDAAVAAAGDQSIANIRKDGLTVGAWVAIWQPDAARRLMNKMDLRVLGALNLGIPHQPYSKKTTSQIIRSNYDIILVKRQERKTARSQSLQQGKA